MGRSKSVEVLVGLGRISGGWQFVVLNFFIIVLKTGNKGSYFFINAVGYL